MSDKDDDFAHIIATEGEVMAKREKRTGKGLRKPRYPCPDCTLRFPTRGARDGHSRTAHRRPGRDASPIKHGTNSGYQKEVRRGLPTCTRCRKAHRKTRDSYRVPKRKKVA